MSDDRDMFSIMLAADSHLGYLDRDPVRGGDSFAAFEEVLLLSQERGADCLLHAGDLFHDNKPSRRALHKAMALLRRYALGDAPVAFQVLSDQAANFAAGRVNYFGRCDRADAVELHPVLLRKGSTRVALYG